MNEHASGSDKKQVSGHGEVLQGQNHPSENVNPPSDTPDEVPVPQKRRRRRNRFIRFMSGGEASEPAPTPSKPEQAAPPPPSDHEVSPPSSKQDSKAMAEREEHAGADESEHRVAEISEPDTAIMVISSEPQEVIKQDGIEAVIKDEIKEHKDLPELLSKTESKGLIREPDGEEDFLRKDDDEREPSKKNIESNGGEQEPHVSLRIRGPPIMDHTWSRATELSGPPRDPLGLGWIIESPVASLGIEKPRGAPINPLRPFGRRSPPDPLVEWLCEDDTLTQAVDAVQGLLQGLNVPTSEEE